MLFHADPSKPTQEVLFSRKKQSATIDLNDIQVERTSYQKHLGILLDEKRNFRQHIDSFIPKINKGISIMKKRQHSLL